jgi:hypothetical protein
MSWHRAFATICFIPCACSGPGSISAASGPERCPVNNIDAARGVAASFVSARAEEGHTSQLGYRLDISDGGDFWLAQDGPNDVRRGDHSLGTQFGGTAF